MKTSNDPSCGSVEHVARRTMLKQIGLTALPWMTPLSEAMALRAEAEKPKGKRAKSVIMIWLQGGASQIETFDPHPGDPIAYDTKAIDTAVKGIQIASTLPLTAEVMDRMSVIRSVVSKEGDHERATYNMKTGYRMDPTLIHPSLGAIICHEQPNSKIEIPTHISLLGTPWPARGGFFGATFDAFQVGDPNGRLRDMAARVSDERQDKRFESLNVIESAFARGRRPDIEAKKTLHNETIAKARRMMTSEQLKAFDIKEATKADREAFGNTRIGRGCLAAMRLAEVGVQCVEVSFGNWDTHVNNHELVASKNKELDPALAALIKGLEAREILDDVVVLVGTEFGRTPKLNGLEGRDHWPMGFSVALAGGGVQGGRLIGATHPEGKKEKPENAVPVENIHATIQHLLGVDYEKEIMTPVERPIYLSEGKLIKQLL